MPVRCEAVPSPSNVIATPYFFRMFFSLAQHVLLALRSPRNERSLLLLRNAKLKRQMQEMHRPRASPNTPSPAEDWVSQYRSPARCPPLPLRQHADAAAAIIHNPQPATSVQQLH